jgi:hypothetical protein
LAVRGGGAGVDTSPPHGGTAKFVGCSFAANVAQRGGALYTQWWTIKNVEDSILWGNSEPQVYQYYSTGWVITYSIVQGGYSGVGNLPFDPLWFEPQGDDLHLRAGSPAINAGNPASPPDPDGSRADMGAIPFDPNWTGLP